MNILFTIVLIGWFCISARAPRETAAIEQVANRHFGGTFLTEKMKKKEGVKWKLEI